MPEWRTAGFLDALDGAKGRMLFLEGDRSNDVIVLREGQVEVIVHGMGWAREPAGRPRSGRVDRRAHGRSTTATIPAPPPRSSMCSVRAQSSPAKTSSRSSPPGPPPVREKSPSNS